MMRHALLAIAAAVVAQAAVAQDRADPPETADPARAEPAVTRPAGPAVAAPEEAAVVAAVEPAVSTGLTQPARDTRPRSAAIDQLDLGTTSITGNQELPKVLYIVPWKQSDLGDLVGRPVNSLLDEVLAPVDRSVFERHLSYYETLHGETGPGESQEE
jgi:hypothetical protein